VHISSTIHPPPQRTGELVLGWKRTFCIGSNISDVNGDNRPDIRTTNTTEKMVKARAVWLIIGIKHEF